MKNLTVVSTIFSRWFLGNLSIVAISFSCGKSNRCLNNFLVAQFSQSIQSFNLVVKGKNLAVVSTIFGFGLLAIYP